ncbi:MAG: DUF4115 domain-containing protein [Burkholderiaceae bacterium]
MTEQAAGPDTSPPETAGALLRAARQAQGLHIAALATTLKVAPRKLEALEGDRYDELQGATFVRALALAACRALKVDPTPVLERLPAQDSGLLSQLDGGLNAPFRERGVRREVPELPGVGNAAWALGLLLLLGALGFWLLPKGWHWPGTGQPASAASASTDTASTATAPWPPAAEASAPVLFEPAPPVAASVPMPVPASATAVLPAVARPVVPPVASAAVVASAPSLPPSPGATVVQLHARGASWVEVVDARSKVLIGRTLAAGETVGLDGVLPLRVKIGNAKVTELSFRGRPVDLEAAARDNVARLELK